MPEESFEQQARKMAEQFSIEPQPVVWQRVEKAIAPKRRRRAALVWWLLPLCIVCGLGFWLMNNKKISVQNKTFVKPTTAAKPNILEQNKNEKEDEKSTQKSSERRNVVSKQFLPKTTIAKTDFFADNMKLKAKEKDAKNKNETVKNSLQSELFTDKNEVKQKEEKANLDRRLIQPQTHLAIESNRVVDSLKTVVQNDVKSKTDTIKTSATIIAKTNDSLKQNKDSAVAKLNKKQKQNKWQMGVVAEAGSSWLGNGLFANKSTSSYAVLSNPSTGSGTGTVTTFIYQHLKAGAHAALGITMQRNVSKRWFFDGQIVYRYQQFSIQTTTTSSLPTQINRNAVKSDIQYRLHFANVYAGIGFSVFHHKNSSVALQTGVDNGWLFSAKQKQNDSLTNLATQEFQRLQPLVNVSIPVSFYFNHITRWQLSPFVRWGLRSLQNNSASYQHHPLNSAGVQFIYFFK